MDVGALEGCSSAERADAIDQLHAVVTVSQSQLLQLVADYDRRRDAIHSIPKEQHRSPEEFGAVDLYGWSEDKARQATMPEEQSFPAYLRARGFKLD